MDRNELVELMKSVFTASEAAEYLNISTQRLHQLVQEKQLFPIKNSKSVTLFYKDDLDQRKMKNYSSRVQVGEKERFDINIPYVRDAILYFTIQQYFNNNDKKTCKFMEQIQNENGFDFRAGLKKNIPLLSNLLKISDKEFYDKYVFVKKSFQQLTSDVYLIQKGNHDYPQLLANTPDAPPYLFVKGDLQLLNEN